MFLKYTEALTSFVSLQEYVKSISTLLLIYDMGALTLDGLILFSAVKGLKTN